MSAVTMKNHNALPDVSRSKPLLKLIEPIDERMLDPLKEELGNDTTNIYIIIIPSILPQRNL